ncbi:MAG: DUF4340 domain-containing protein [Phycisphaerae bacterium]|nr:DUF4340 domain-containing protein [Phycisphaerae bacterium]
MNVKTTMALAVILIVGVGAFLIFGPDKPAGQDASTKETDQKAKPLYELAQLVKFEVEAPGKPKLVFTKPLKEGKSDEYEDWQMVEPIKSKATNWEVNSFADKFKSPKYKEEFTPGQGGFPSEDKISLAKPKAVITVTDAKGASRKVELGDRVFGGEQTYIKISGEPKAYIAEVDVREDLKKDAKKFRSKDLFDFDKSKAVQVEVTDSGKTYTIIKGEGDKWVIEPIKAPADKAKIDSLISDIRYLRAEEFVEDAPKNLAAFGLDKPKTSIKVTIEDKIEKKDEKAGGEDKPTTTQAEEKKFEIKRSDHVVQFGGASDLKGDKFFCKLGDQPWVVSVTKATYEKVQPKLDQWRDSKVTQAKVLDAEKIALTVGGGTLTLVKKEGSWKRDDAKGGKAEESAVTDLLNGLKDLKAQSWVDDPKDVKEYGLDKPRAEIVLSIKGQPGVERIVVGGDTKSGLLTYVHEAASKSIAVVKLDAAKKLLVPALSYQDRTVQKFVKSRADRIELAGKDGTVVLTKAKGAWKMDRPVSAEADTDAVNDLLSNLGSLKARQIAGEGDPAKFGLDKPELTVTVQVQAPPKAKPKPTTSQASTSSQAAASKPAATKPASTQASKPDVYVLKVTKKDDKVYACVPKSKLIHELDKAVYNALTAETHERKPLKFETSEAVAVDVVGGEKPLKFAKKDDKWSYVPDPYLAIDEKKVTDLLSALRDLKVERYVSYGAKDLKAFGLDKPELTVTVKTKDKTFEMLLSAADKDGKRKAALKAASGAMKVFVVGKGDVGKFAKKIGDFVKS